MNLFMKDINNLAEIIKREIYNENIALYEYMAYQNKNWNNKVINIDSILESDIVDNILNSRDMNVIGGVDISSFIISDLNVFLETLKNERNKDLKSDIIRIITTVSDVSDDDVLLAKLSDYFKYHTYLENLDIKRLVLVEKNHIAAYSFNDDYVENVFEHFYISSRQDVSSGLGR